MPYKDRETQLQYWRERYKAKSSEILSKMKARYQAKGEQIRADNNKRYHANKERYLAACKVRYYANRQQRRDKARDWYTRNKDRHKETSKRWAERNREKLLAYHREWSKGRTAQTSASLARRRAAQKRAIPKWADTKLIADVYKESARITKETGTRHHVDHIFPIRSTVVCGLHVHYNLQVLPMIENLKKGNKFAPEPIRY